LKSKTKSKSNLAMLLYHTACHWGITANTSGRSSGMTGHRIIHKCIEISEYYLSSDGFYSLFASIIIWNISFAILTILPTRIQFAFVHYLSDYDRMHSWIVKNQSYSWKSPSNRNHGSSPWKTGRIAKATTLEHLNCFIEIPASISKLSRSKCRGFDPHRRCHETIVMIGCKRVSHLAMKWLTRLQQIIKWISTIMCSRWIAMKWSDALKKKKKKTADQKLEIETIVGWHDGLQS